METKSLYAEIDRPGTEARSDRNPGESTADQCYEGAQASLSEAIENRRIAYDRMGRWVQDDRQRYNQARDLRRALAEGRRKRRELNEGEAAVLADLLVLDTDRMRGEHEVFHWRELVEWWRQRAALKLSRMYGGSRSARDLVRSLADATAMAS